MFEKNEGKTDRIIRGVVGAVLLVLAFTVLAGILQWLAAIIGIVLLLTAITGMCLAYRLFGINTDKA